MNRVSQNILAERIQRRMAPSNLAEHNYATVARVHINHLQAGGDTFTRRQLRRLKDVARQCPNQGGNAVYYARNLLLSVGISKVPSTSTCDDLVPERHPVVIDSTMIRGGMASDMLDENGESVLRLYPNPSNNEFVLEWLGDAQAGQLLVFNVEGKTMHTASLDSQQPTQTVRTADWPTGLYLVRVQYDNGKTFAARVNVIH
jgi:hypothetical protein